jgi:hypothetical protein
MGYCTRYNLSIQRYEDTEYQKKKAEMSRNIQEILDSNIPNDTADRAIEAIKEKFEVKDSIPTVKGVIAYLGHDPFEASCKWYEHADDMIKISKKYPDVLFILSGEGEESGDIWKEYFYKGKVQIANAIVTFDPFDPSKLQNV